jgi:hypothetical protein
VAEPPPVEPEQRQAEQPSGPVMASPEAPIETLEPPRDVPAQPRPQPTRRFFPTGPGQAPVINNNRLND